MGQFDFSSPVAARNPCSSPQRALPSRVGRQAGLRPLPTDRRGRKHTRGLSLPVHPGRRRWTTCVALVYRPTHGWWNAGVVGRGRRSPTLRQHVVLIRTTLNVEGGQSMRTAVPPVSPRVRACRGTRSISARGSERALGGGLAAGRYQHRQSEPAGAGAGEQRCGFAPPLRAVCAQRRCASGAHAPHRPRQGRRRRRRRRRSIGAAPLAAVCNTGDAPWATHSAWRRSGALSTTGLAPRMAPFV